tara:strand:- start:19 stop:822 length:804 start_codon:yes stop_codon:yes gene_type:complete
MLKLGINQNITNEDYHGDREYESSSTLKLYLKDPKEYHNRYILKLPREEKYKSAYDFGSYIHSLILEPEKVDDEYAIFEGASRRGNAYKEFKAENEGKIIITRSQFLQAQAILEAYTEHELASSMVTRGKAEQTLCVELEGMKIKVRADYVKYGQIIDVKTTSDPVDRFAVGKTVVRFDYDLSAALYVDAFTKYFGNEFEFYFLFINKMSNEIEVLKASKNLLENGRRKYKKSIQLLKKARETGKYFEEGIQEVDIPSWAVFDDTKD